MSQQFKQGSSFSNSGPERPSQNGLNAATYIATGSTVNFIEAAKGIATYLKTIDTNQIRNFYDAVKALELELAEKGRNEAKLAGEAKLLPTKLAWAVAKMEGSIERSDRKKDFKQFYLDIQKMVEALFEQNSPDRIVVERYTRFKDFVEAVVIYHKAVRERVI